MELRKSGSSSSFCLQNLKTSSKIRKWYFKIGSHSKGGDPVVYDQAQNQVYHLELPALRKTIYIRNGDETSLDVLRFRENAVLAAPKLATIDPTNYCK